MTPSQVLKDDLAIIPEWIEHDGKGIPVDGSQFVAVRFRDGGTDENAANPSTAWYWHNERDIRLSNWFHDEVNPCGSEIVAYRVVSAPTTSPEESAIRAAEER